MTDTDPTKITVNMTDQSMAALTDTAALLGLSHTDTLNRAVQAYALLLAAEPGRSITLTNAGCAEATP